MASHFEILFPVAWTFYYRSIIYILKTLFPLYKYCEMKYVFICGLLWSFHYG